MTTLTRILAPLLAALLLAACGGGGGSSTNSNGNNGNNGNNDDNNDNLTPEYDFGAIDAALQEFLDGNEHYDGLSITLVDRDKGTVHEGEFGDHTPDIVLQLASASKIPSVTLLMALDADDSLNYDVAATIDNYLPWDGVYGDRTSVHLVSNTSGIPGLANQANYGAHQCQFSGLVTLQACAETLFTVLLEGTVPPGTMFDYGGSQWQLAGAVAENVTNSTWNQAFNAYIGEPCNMEVFTYGNMLFSLQDWTGNPDSLTGQQNPLVEGGAIANMRDYAKILLLHLREGRCGNTQVIPAEAVELMQIDRAGTLGETNYGMGWWIFPGNADNARLVYDPGAYGSISWLDMERGIGGFIGVDDYSQIANSDVGTLALATIIPLQQAAVDASREAAN